VSILIPVGPHLSKTSGVHVVFGKVIKGYEDVVKKLAQVPVDAKDRPQTPIIITNCGELELKKPKSAEQAKREHAKPRKRHDSRSRSRSADRERRRKKSKMQVSKPEPSMRTLKDRRETLFHKRRRKNMTRVWNAKNGNGWQMLNAKSWSASNE
jgi:hypothetical protein